MDLLPPESGFLVIDKPEGPTSHDVVQIVRRQLSGRKVGHLGTLDPMATGVLPLAIGKATRLVKFLKDGVKVYEGTIRLGFSTDTYDKQGRPSSPSANPRTSQEQLNELAVRMSGEQSQLPPQFSAKKVRGVRAYRLAREGISTEIAPQRVQIDHLIFALASCDEIHFTIRCSAGTYVRSVAHDLGVQLGCGAHVSRLRRLASGEFAQSQSVALGELDGLRPAEIAVRMISLARVLVHFPSVVADAAVERALSAGQDFRVLEPPTGIEEEKCLVRVLSPDGRMLGLAEPVSVAAPASAAFEQTEFRFHPVVVLMATR
jgi:tRNA pseudouridine55 synthase